MMPIKAIHTDVYELIWRNFPDSIRENRVFITHASHRTKRRQNSYHTGSATRGQLISEVILYSASEKWREVLLRLRSGERQPAHYLRIRIPGWNVQPTGRINDKATPVLCQNRTMNRMMKIYPRKQHSRDFLVWKRKPDLQEDIQGIYLLAPGMKLGNIIVY